MNSTRYRANVKRFIGITSTGTEKDKGLPWIMDSVLRYTAFAGFIGDMRKMEVYLETKGQDLDWTIARPPGLNDGELQPDDGRLRYSERSWCL